MSSSGIGPVGEPFPDVRRIVVRGGGLGDLLFAIPAIESLAAAYPRASIVLLGSPLHADLLGGRPGPVGSVLTLPADTGTTDAGAGEAAELAGRAGPFDLGVQLVRHELDRRDRAAVRARRLISSPASPPARCWPMSSNC